MDKYTLIINQPIKLAENDKIRIRGRHTVEDEMLAFDWSGSGFAFNFVGTGLIISLGAYGGD